MITRSPRILGIVLREAADEEQRAAHYDYYSPHMYVCTVYKGTPMPEGRHSNLEDRETRVCGGRPAHGAVILGWKTDGKGKQYGLFYLGWKILYCEVFADKSSVRNRLYL